jgi:hypothetical protein
MKDQARKFRHESPGMSENDRKTPQRKGEAGAGSPAAAGDTEHAVDAFLREAQNLAPVASGANQGRLIFALDATMSRQPTWDLACRVQASMFDTAARIGGLAVQLVYFRGFGECRASRWVSDARALTSMMTGIDCRGGLTQIERVLRHVRKSAGERRISAFIYVGDAMEEDVDRLCGLAGELGLSGVKGFMFHEGGDPEAGRAFREIARLTGGAYEQFDAAAPGALEGLLRAAAAYAAGGEGALRKLADGDAGARRLLTSMRRS